MIQSLLFAGMEPEATFAFPEPLTERYRPGVIADFAGLPEVKRVLTGFAARPMNAVVAKAEGSIQPPQAGPLVMPMQFGNLQFGAFGTYNWSLQFDGHEPFLTEFQVLHAPLPPNLRMAPMR